MSEVRIFVEGDSDKKFIEDYISFLSIDEQLVRVEMLNGKDEDKFKKSQRLFEAGSDLGRNLVIIDADYEDVANKKAHILNLKEKIGINFDLFLFPDDINLGELETILKNIIHAHYQPFFDNCLKNFNDCVTELGVGLNGMSLKDQIYNYLCAHLSKQESDQRGPLISPSKMKYNNNRFWDLNSPYLNPLKNFLSEYFSNT